MSDDSPEPPPNLEPVGYRRIFSLVCAAALLSFGVLVFCEVFPPGYSAGLPLRAQTEALLRGEFALSHNPADLALVPWDLCWSQGGVHQVWGLGIPLWRLPWEALAKVAGWEAFPDRIALGLFMTVVAYAVLSTWFNGSKGGVVKSSVVAFPSDDRDKQTNSWMPSVLGLGATFLALGFAPAIHLLHGPMTQYDEAVAYVYFFGIALAYGIIALVRTPTWPRFAGLCALAGLGAFIRPTLLFYGAATVFIAGWIMFSHASTRKRDGELRQRSWPRLFFGFGLFGAGNGLLFLTNYLRFGSGWEFGHNINLTPTLPLIYIERFSNPFSHVPLLEAARELFGAAFLAHKFNDVGFYDPGIFPGQSSTIRWRMIDLTTYDLSYAVLLVIAWSIGIWSCVRRWRPKARHSNEFADRPYAPQPVWTVLLVWSFIATVALIAFYIRLPVLASRYLLDFSPAFAIALTGLWCAGVGAISRRRSSWTLLVMAGIALVTWQTTESVNGKSDFGPPRSYTKHELLAQMHPAPSQVRHLPEQYCIGNNINSWKIPFNGAGWNDRDGSIGVCAIFFVESPRFLELEVSPVGEIDATPDPSCIRAKIGLEFLDATSVVRTNGDWLLHFAGAKNPDSQSGIQPVFIATVPSADLARYVSRPSPWRLKRIAWR